MTVPSKRILIAIGIISIAAPARTQVMGRISSTQTTIASPAAHDTTARNVPAPSDETSHDFRNDELFRSSSRSGLELRFLHETKTPFMTQSRVPLAQVPGTRLQVNFFVTSIKNANFMLAPQGAPQATQALRQPRSSDLYGVGVSIPFGRYAGSGGSQGLLHGLSRILHGR